MGLLNKVKSISGGSSSKAAQFPPPRPAPRLDHAMTRYRRQRGVNLGSWFTTEDWLATELYTHAVDPKKSDFDLARAPDAKNIMEHHWDTWITDADWQWIKDRGFNAVRLPIGYYHLSGVMPEVLKGTDYEPYAQVYEGAWGRILGAIEKAQQYGLGVLIDFHSAAGAQNCDAHSGMSNGKVNFWDKHNLKSTSIALQYLASAFAGNTTVVGLEILNEPKNDSRLQSWYDSQLKEVRGVAGPDFPVYLSDGWDTAHYTDWDGSREDFVVIDHHLYRCFTDADKQKTGTQHADELCHVQAQEFQRWATQAKGRLVVGEWSAGLDDSVCLPNASDGERDAQKRAWVNGQLDLFDNVLAGYWFWTLKTDRPWDAGWSAYNAAQAEILPRSMIRKRFTPPQPGALEQACQQACAAHCNYWQNNGGQPNAQVFTAAFTQAWNDALMFLQSEGQQQLGFVYNWSLRRRDEYTAAGGALGSDAWQWDHAFQQGVSACHAQSLS